MNRDIRSIGVAILLALVTLAAVPARATFEGSNGKIAHVIRLPLTTAIADADGRQLTFPDAPYQADTDPAFSPDGEQLIYVRGDGPLNKTFIRIMNADGSNDHQFLSSDSISQGAELSSPSWSADGQKIAFNASVSGAMNEGGIFTIDANGQNLVRVVENDSTTIQTTFEPEWSPHGRTIAFRCRYRFAPPGIRVDDYCTLDLTSGTFRVLPIDIKDLGVDIPLLGRTLYRPSWTPDGQRLIFSVNHMSTDTVAWDVRGPDGEPLSSGESKYLVVDPFSIRKDGASLQRLRRGRPVVPPSGGVTSDLWFYRATPSPDGELIVGLGFSGAPNGFKSGIYRLQKDGVPVLIKEIPDALVSSTVISRVTWQAITSDPAVYVTDGHGNPIDGLRVELRSFEDSEQVLYSQPTQAGNGTYVFENAPLGTYVVRVTLVDTTAPAGSPPSFEVRDADTFEVANLDRKVVFTGTSPKTFSFDDSDLGNLLGSSASGDRLDDLAAIFRNMNRYLGWVRRNLQPDTGPTASIVAFSSYRPEPDFALYNDALDTIFMGPAASAYENRDGIPDFPAHDDDAPENGEWHEFTHHLTHHHVWPIPNCTPRVNHLGYRNPSTCDSLLEGLAMFFPAIAEREITGQANSWYVRFADLETHIKAWRPWPTPVHPNATAEDAAVAALIWDLVDSEVDFETLQYVIAANGNHVFPYPLRDGISMSPSELWTKLKSSHPLTVKDLHTTLSTPATGAAEITVDLDGISPADVSRLDLVFLMHGFYSAIYDLDAPGVHLDNHYNVGTAQVLNPSSPRNAHVGLTDHFIYSPENYLLGGLYPRLKLPGNPGAQLSVEVRDTAGNPLSGATVQLELPHTDFETAPLAPTGPSQRFETGSGVMSFEPPFFVDYPLAEGGALPACDGPNVTRVAITVSATLNGHASLNQPVLDNCDYWQAVLAGTSPAASVTLTFPAEATQPVTTAYKDLVPAENGRAAYWSIELNCDDAGAGNYAAGCARTEYRVGGGPITTYDRPLRLPPPVQRLEFRSIDAAGNTESFQEISFDSDADGLSDAVEMQQGTNPLLADSDSDGTADPTDNCAVVVNADQLNTDADALGDACDDDDDGDGLSDVSEIAAGTNPLNPDTDGDALNDFDELAASTNPLDPDSDDDNLEDGDEIAAGANPLDPDSDDDGLLDGSEVARGTSPIDADSDDDGVGDAVDNCAVLANPGQEDRDNDGEGDVCDPNSGSTWKLIGITTDDRWANVKATLFELDTSNASATLVMALGNGGPGEAIAFNPNDGFLYHGSGTVAGDKVWESIDVATTTIRTSGELTTFSGSQVAGMTYNPATGRFLVLDTGHSFFDTTIAGVATYIGGVPRGSGLAFVGGVLYEASSVDGTLYQLDPNTGAYISDVNVTLAGVSVEGTAGLATDPETGTLWIIINRPGDTQYLATINPITGVATAVGVLPDGFSGIAFVPEPTARLMLAAGAMAMAFFATHRKRRRRNR